MVSRIPVFVTVVLKCFGALDKKRSSTDPKTCCPQIDWVWSPLAGSWLISAGQQPDLLCTGWLALEECPSVEFNGSVSRRCLRPVCIIIIIACVSLYLTISSSLRYSRRMTLFFYELNQGLIALLLIGLIFICNTGDYFSLMIFCQFIRSF